MFKNLKFWLGLGLEMRRFILINDINPDRFKLTLLRMQASLTGKKTEVEEADDFLKWLSQRLLPKEKFELIRVGGKYDGGYHLLAMSNIKLLFSAGIGKNCDFEDEMAKLTKAQIIACDPTISNYPNSNPSSYINFEKRWFTSSHSCDHEAKICLAEIDLNEFPTGSTSLLKMDIEGSEHDILLYDWDAISNFDQLIIEFHDFYKLADTKFRLETQQIFEKILQEFTCVSFHSNNWAPILNYGRSFCPDIFEVTLVKNSYLEKTPKIKREVSPVVHKSNNPNLADIPNSIFSI
jgi:hypothetical protein